MKINHFGFLTKDINKSLAKHQLLGYKAISDIIYDELRGVDILFLESSCNKVIELVSQAKQSEKSVVDGLTKRFNDTVYHTCYETEDINKSIEELTQKAVAFDNRKVCFLMSKHIGTIELLEL